MELQKRKFNGIRQVSMSVFNSSPDKEGYLWFVKDGSVDEWDTRKEWEGFMICEDYTSGTVALEQSNNLFASSKITVNFTNLTHNGEKITADYEGQLCYVWYDNGNKKETDKNRIPTVNFL